MTAEDVKEYWSQCDEERKRQVERAEKAEAWILEAKAFMVYMGLNDEDMFRENITSVCKKLIDEAPI